MKSHALLVVLALIALAAAAGKRGLPLGSPFNAQEDLKPFQKNGAISWMYNWGTNSPANLSSIQYIPMQWNQNGIEKLEANVLKTCSPYVLGFNEPDLQEQAGMTPAHSCDLWKQYFIPLKQKYGIKLGLPVVTNGGQKWLAEFMQLCPNHQADFLPLHWYGQYMGDLTWYLGSVHTKYPNLPIWITEYASVLKNSDEVVKFAKESMAYLEATEWIERYAWFGTWRTNSDWPVATLTSDGKLSPVGQAYVDAPYVDSVKLTSRCGPTPTSSTTKKATTSSTSKATTSTTKKPTTSSTTQKTSSTVTPSTTSQNKTSNRVILGTFDGKFVQTGDRNRRLSRSENGTVYIMNYYNDKAFSLVDENLKAYVTADAGGKGPLIANRAAASTWEKFWLVNQGDKVAFKSWANSKFVTVQNDGDLLADSTSAEGKALFTIKYL